VIRGVCWPGRAVVVGLFFPLVCKSNKRRAQQCEVAFTEYPVYNPRLLSDLIDVPRRDNNSMISNRKQWIQLLRLAITLTLLWLLLSGMFKPLLLFFGGFSVLLVCYFAATMKMLSHRGQLLYFRPGALIVYWLWLMVEILKSNFKVTMQILHPRLPIDPQLKAVPARQKTELGRVTYANSITLTPGTVAINIGVNGDILVHALNRQSIEELESGELNQKVANLEYPTQ
jgi:multicomponent Na+:H+ antiporter subunit E